MDASFELRQFNNTKSNIYGIFFYIDNTGSWLYDEYHQATYEALVDTCGVYFILLMINQK